MVLEHEIPDGSKIYFGEIAKKKRSFENIASETFYKYGFQEMITPIFSYHQIKSLSSQQLIHLTDKNNYQIAKVRDNIKTNTPTIFILVISYFL